MATMTHLEKAILKVLESASDEGCSDDLIVIESTPLKELQAEANIYFREPDAPQIDEL